MNIPLIAPYFILLKKNPQYRWLWLSQVVSLIGDWFNVIATTTLVAGLSGSGLAVSGLFVARLMPPFLLGPVVGVVADRFDRRKILLASDILRIFVVLGFLLVQTAQDIWLLYTLTVLQLSLSAFFEPTRSALMPSIVPEEDLITANALSGITWSSMLAIGAALGGLATALFGLTAAFIIDALTFAISALFVYQIDMPDMMDISLESQTGWRSYIDGLRYLCHEPHILMLTLVKGASALSFGAADVIQANFAENIFQLWGNSAATLGLIYAAVGIGTGVGPLLAKHYTAENQVAMRWAITLSFVMVFIGYMGIAWSSILPGLLLGTIIRGAGTGIAWVYSSTLLQISVPSAYRGRVFAFDMAIAMLAATTSIVAGGYAFDSWALNAWQVSFVFGCVALLTLVGWFVYHQIYLSGLKNLGDG